MTNPLGLLCFLFVLWPTISSATASVETHYISDQLIITMREQPQQSAGPVALLSSDTAVALLDIEGEYARIRTADEKIGYIKRAYLKKQTPKSIIIEKQKTELAQKQERIDRLQPVRDQYDLTVTQLEETRATLEKTTESYQNLRKKSQGLVSIVEQRDHLLKDNKELLSRVTKLQKENESLINSKALKWFLSGAGLLFAGWLLGKLSRGRRRNTIFT